MAKHKSKLSVRILQYVVLCILVILVVVCGAVFIQIKVNPNKIPSIFGYKPFVVLSGSMEAEIFRGDLAVTREVDTNEIQKSDIIAFRDSEGHIVTHRVVDIIENNGEKEFVTKGDNNDRNDPNTVNAKEVESKYLFKLGGFGNFVMIMQQPVTLVIVLAVIVVVGGIWMMLDKKKLSEDERKELERLRKEKGKLKDKD